MFEMFPFIINSFLGGNINNQNINNNNFNNLNNNTNNFNTLNNFNNLNSHENFNSNNLDGLVNSFSGVFNNIFTNVFTAVITNEELIDNIVDSVLNNEVISSMIESLDEELDLELIDYKDKFLIEGKIVDVKKRDIDIDYNDDYITVKVNKDNVYKEDNIAFGIFSEGNNLEKKFYVPNVDTGTIRAVYNANVLRIYMKKKFEEKEEINIIDVDSFSTID